MNPPQHTPEELGKKIEALWFAAQTWEDPDDGSVSQAPKDKWEARAKELIDTKVIEGRIDEVVRNPHYNADAEYGYFVNRLKELTQEQTQ